MAKLGGNHFGKLLCHETCDRGFGWVRQGTVIHHKDHKYDIADNENNQTRTQQPKEGEQLGKIKFNNTKSHRDERLMGKKWTFCFVFLKIGTDKVLQHGTSTLVEPTPLVSEILAPTGKLTIF